jgi:hypothetical protein
MHMNSMPARICWEIISHQNADLTLATNADIFAVTAIFRVCALANHPGNHGKDLQHC